MIYPFAERCQKEAEQLRINIRETAAWDGEWFLRAFFDDGTPLGSSKNDECKIDAIAQSWSVLSGAYLQDPRSCQKGYECLDNRLVHKETGLIQLLDPPFDKSDLNPGYIKGYVPGVRENGGQCTHGAIWAAMAFAALGDNRRAWEILTMINPVNHARSSEADGDLQSGTVCCRGRRLCVAAAHRPWRLDVVHRLGQLDVPVNIGIFTRTAA